MQEAINSISHGQIPEEWLKYAYATKKSLANFIQDFLHRINYFQNWVDSGIPASVWLPGFYSPRAFLATIRLNFTRKHKIPVDEIELEFDLCETPNGDSIEISGLFLSGARFDRELNSLAELNPRQLHDELPGIACTPQNVEEKIHSNTYICPTYVLLSDRKDMEDTPGGNGHFIMEIPLRIPSDSSPDHWILRGVAALCQLN
ncbi:dynein axonemal heavy chain 12-like [Lutzomyia longipalpis]|uniref:dynein axonemal heavy chain 12-like n=1 Tax=Lutzomyia longipalpis TaxID=7200 RepID=UPI0024842FC1|nr:dynein axonemal heavy chain 12-like [Lutzomyia longipalpis]